MNEPVRNCFIFFNIKAEFSELKSSQCFFSCLENYFNYSVSDLSYLIFQTRLDILQVVNIWVQQQSQLHYQTLRVRLDINHDQPVEKFTKLPPD